MRRAMLVAGIMALVCAAGCELPGSKSDTVGPAVEEGLTIAPKLRFSDIPVPRGLVYVPKDSWTFEGKGGVRLADLVYKGRVSLQDAVEFFLDQMPISGWENEMVVGPETKKRLRFRHTKKSERCEIVIEKRMGSTLVTIRID